MFGNQATARERARWGLTGETPSVAEDAHVLQEEFFPKIDKRDLVRLGKYQVFLKLMIEGGEASEGFGAGTLGPEKEWEEYILKMS